MPQIEHLVAQCTTYLQLYHADWSDNVTQIQKLRLLFYDENKFFVVMIN